MKITLGLLTNRGIKAKTVICLLTMLKETPEFEWVPLLSINGYSISENRNWLAAQAVKNESDYLLMIDDDQIFPADTAKVLVSRDKDIIGVPYNVKELPKEGEEKTRRNNVTYDPDIQNSETDPFEVLAVGAGVMLIKTDVFRKLSQPWFNIEQYENGMTKVGEDSWFCYKAASNGYKTFLEPTLQGLGHIGDLIF